MASPYNQGPPSDIALQSPLGSPDFGFLQQNLMRSNQQYEAGEKEAVSGYSSILNAPLTDDGNIEQRRQYVNRIQDGLKKIAPTDLSLPQNVQQAENLYAPFWQDTPMLQDMSYTKYAQGELSKLDSWKSSTDKTVRGQYSSDASDWINQGLNKLKTANRDPNIYKNLQRREAIPFADINADVDAAYKEEQQKGIDTVTTNGNGITTEHNGIKSKDAFRTWYLSKVGSKYDKQLYISESVRVQREKDEIKQQYPQLTDPEINQHFANEQMGKLSDIYQGNISAYNKVSDEYSKKYDDLYTQIQKQPKHQADQGQAATIADYLDKIKSYQSQATQYTNEFKKYGSGNTTSDEYQKTLQDITEHPEDYLASIQKGIMADNWATGMSVMNTSTKVELDPRWQAYQTEHDKALDRQLEAQKISAEKWKTEAGYREHTGQTSKGVPIPGFDPNRNSGWYGAIDNSTNTATQPGIPNPGTGSFTGLATADIAKIPTGVDIVSGIQAANMKRITDNVFSPTGIAGALSVDGVSSSDIINFTEGMKNAMTGVKPNTVQSTAYERIKKVLNDNGIHTDDIHGPNGAQQALLKYSSIAAQKLINSGNVDQMKRGASLMKTYLDISQDRDLVLSNQRTYDNAVKDEIFSNPEYNKLVKVGTDGTKHFVTVDDMAKDFPSVQLGDENGRTIRELSPLQFAKYYREGKVSIPGGNTITVDGSTYNITGVNGSSHNLLHMPSADLNQLIFNSHSGEHSIEAKYGAPGELTGLLKTASEKVIPKLKGYQNGLIVQNVGWDPAIPRQKDMAIGISKDVANLSNGDYISAYENGKAPQGNDPNIQAVRGIIGSGEDMPIYTSGPQLTVTPDGRPAYAYTFKANAPDKVVGADNVHISSLAGRTFVIPLSPLANAPYINSVPTNTGQFIHSEILYDQKPIESDPTIQASGFKSIIHPYSPVDGKNTKCHIEIQHSIPDPKFPGQTKWVTVDQTNINILHGEGAKNPDEIAGISNYMLSQHLSNLIGDAQNKQINVGN